ncbi:MAG: HAD family hydrolase [Lachnospiraceae bacterium]
MKQNKRIIFLDIDGTIYGKPGIIPESAKQAVRLARENGHRIYLGTGRNKAEVAEDIWDMGFDGMVGSAGAYVEHQGELIFNQHLPQSYLNDLYRFFEKHKIVYTVETNDYLYGTRENVEKQYQYFEHVFTGDAGEIKSLELFDSITKIVDDIYQVKDVNKILFYDAPVTLEEVRREFGDHFMVTPSSVGKITGESAEMYDVNISKATGIEHLLTYLGEAQEDTIAFGDGSNDFEMLEYVGIGIAMGNGVSALKKTADMVTDTAINDGLYKGFKLCGLI